MTHHALGHLALGDDAVHRGDQGEGLFHLPGFLQCGDLGVRDVPILQALAGRGQEPPGPFLQFGEAALLQGLQVFQGQEILVLGGHQLRAVNAQKILAPVDGVAGGPDIEALHPAVHLGGDDVQVALVKGDHAHGQGQAGQGAHLHFGGGHAHGLDGGGVDLDGARGLFPGAFIHRHQVHAAGGLAGLVPDVARVHGGHPVLDLAFPLGGRGAGRGGRRLPQAAFEGHEGLPLEVHPGLAPDEGGVRGGHPQLDGLAGGRGAGLGGINRHQFLALFVLPGREADESGVRGGDVAQGLARGRGSRGGSFVAHEPEAGKIQGGQGQGAEPDPQHQSPPERAASVSSHFTAPWRGSSWPTSHSSSAQVPSNSLRYSCSFNSAS